MAERVVILGAGPAGLAAARGAVAAGKQVIVIDDNARAGGQIWRGQGERTVPGAEFRFGATVTGIEPERKVVRIAAQEVAYDRLIFANGARELYLPFPGWTMPHVMGAGGLQAMVKEGMDVRGRRVVVCGSGPLLLAVAANLEKAGANVIRVAEQANWSSLIAFGTSLWRWPDKLAQAATLGSWRFRAGQWPVRAYAGGVELSTGEKLDCDWVACGWGLVPNTELAQLAGCELRGGFVAADRFAATNVPSIFAVGELTGIGGVEKAEAEGFAAGAGRAIERDWQEWVRRLDSHFALREELLELAEPETTVCRCEDVPLGRLRQATGWRDAKLQTRCGMGPCQGRICGPAVEKLCGWKPDSVRPPVYPVRVKDLLEQ